MADEQTQMNGVEVTVELTTKIVSAYVGNNPVQSGELPDLIKTVHGSLQQLNGERREIIEQKPVVPIRRSKTDEYLICLEDGKKFKSLKRHLKSKYNMTPEEYREKWNLPHDYPMVAPAYARQRSELAKQMGLGQSRKN